MGRIRSIKPEFSTDGSILRLSDSCALFFILLWNYCDDEGKHPLDLNQLVAELGGRWHKGKVKLYVSCLIKSGQLRLNSDSTWIQVTGWSHQKIDKPRQPKVKADELQWLNHIDSTIALESSSNVRRKDRIGSDTIGSDRMGSDGVQQKPSKAVRKRPASANEKSLGSKIFDSYAQAYEERYGKQPVRNAAVNAQCGQIGSRLGEDGIEVAKFYVSHNRQFYFLKSHPIKLLLSDCEGLHTEWVNGKQTTSTEARSAENKQQAVNAFSKFLKPEGVT